MTAEKYFEMSNRLHELIISDKLEIDYLNELLKFSNDSEIKSRIEELEDSIYNEMEQYVSMLKKIRDVINKIEDIDEMLVLKYRYILHYSFRRISNKMKLSNRQLGRIHIAGLKHANKVLKEGGVNAKASKYK